MHTAEEEQNLVQYPNWPSEALKRRWKKYHLSEKLRDFIT